MTARRIFQIGIGLLLFSALAPPALAMGTGGPDFQGYGIIPIPPNLRDITATGNLLSLSDDEISSSISIGFSFDFLGGTQWDVLVSSNGFVTFDTSETSDGCCAGYFLPSNDHISTDIAAFWTDLNPGDGGDILTETRGTAPNREFIVGFYGVTTYDSDPNDPTTVTFEVILHETTNEVELQYGTAARSFEDVSIGVENGSDRGICYRFEAYTAGAEGGVLMNNQGFLLTTNLPACGGRTATILGTVFADAITGTDGDDVILGFSGNDSINGLGGNDVICGGDGHDMLSGGSGRDLLIGGNGRDICDGGSGRDRARRCAMEMKVP